MESYETSFTGKILKRGFWLYVWRISSGEKTVWYVGRTGDSSSANAASPFGRLSQHLDLRPSAKANMLATNLRNSDMIPDECEYNLLTLGPLFPEQSDFEDHKPYRDIVGKLEAELAYTLSQRGLLVLGTHPKRGDFDKTLFTEVLSKANAFVKNG
ncbi:hypothetical protein I0D00_11905 [Pseudomonas lalucatii]|uniref:GIY-YIG domain-containing protein n=1 Tax=Pseudomonas lalucatii TaxID=1424203 RepID=A0ABS5Q1I6_9PSED|nr:hypothetical protein [Pseudomonas lalucatii]MBS7662637.1 hypothetical protein [Pseudomonas lalucatii]